MMVPPHGNREAMLAKLARLPENRPGFAGGMELPSNSNGITTTCAAPAPLCTDGF
jgi:hypothetical protein